MAPLPVYRMTIRSSLAASRARFSRSMRQAVSCDGRIGWAIRCSQPPRWQAAALLQTGKCQEKLGELAEAEKTYAEVVKRYANTSWATDASERLRVAETGQQLKLKR